ncbi:hypothetical protein [Teredinibacter sp. KSP-S5-2]|uniref:hypothetical protein n=1 Tax=Teredinibacter sp. KSP-S5-2 TaxID=3034506 RepID=UPI0029343D5F|nr:hypothetical protein [Teredinibacter sp. KSP-S5-2]WNO10612.1 hypothetical protein P5V12_05435 [Teredinibacter sp. KSP-S5-2]
MYIWKTRSLAEDIKNNRISSNEWKKYYLAVSIFMTVSLYLLMLSPRENTTAVLVESIAMVGILIFGVSFTYRSNMGDDGVDYISRMTALTFPILIKLFLISLLGGVVIGVLSEALSFSITVLEWSTTFFSILIQVIFFWRINIFLKYINA